MKILVVGDTHGKKFILMDYIGIAHKMGIDTVVQVGDFGCHLSLEQINAYCEDKNVNLHFLPGNHEHWNIMDMEYPDRIFYHPIGDSATFDGVTCKFVGGATSVDRNFRTPGYDWFPEEELLFSMGDTIEGEATIMFSHDCPSLVDIPPQAFMPDAEYIFGEKVMHRAAQHRDVLASVTNVVKPQLLIHGHYHHGYEGEFTHDGGTSTVIGLGKEMNSNSACVIDTEDLSHSFVQWESVALAQRQSVAQRFNSHHNNSW